MWSGFKIIFNYFAFGLNISSQIELPGVMETTRKDNPDVKIILGEVENPIFQSDLKGSNYYVDLEDVYVWWENIGNVKISSGNHVIVEVKSDLKNSDDSIIPFLLGPVMSILLRQRGFLVLHGSSVKINNKAIAFLGFRGLGKSTIAVNLYKKGYPLITDDIVAINFGEDGLPLVYSGYPHVRLSEDSYSYVQDETSILTHIRTYAGKVFCDTSRGFSLEAVNLTKIFILEESENNRISIFKPQENLINLILYSIPYGIFDNNNIDRSNNFTQIAKLINNIYVYRLEHSHSFKNLPKSIDLVLNSF